MRSPRLLVVCALILAPVTGIPLSTAPNAPPPAPGVNSKSPGTVKQPINDSVSHLAITSGQINSTTIETTTLDISSSVVSDGSRFQRTYRIHRFDAAYENASNKQAVVDAALNQSENRIATLQKRQKEAINEYNDDMSTQTFLRKLAFITAEAEQTSVFVEHVGKKTNSNRATYLRGDLNSFTGPVRTRIRSALQGDPDAPKRYFVRTTSQGIVLGAIDDGQYVRETYLSGARTGSNNSTSPSFEEARKKFERSYPSIDSYDARTIRTLDSHYVYKLPHSYGQLTTKVDRTSGEIFYEKQTVSISDERTVAGPQNTNGPFALTTRVTYPGGYMIVRLTDPENDETVNGTITVGNETVGTTEDGELAMLQPPNGTTINATVDTETVSVTLGKTSAGPSGPPQSDSAIESPDRRLETEQLRAAKRAESLL